MECGRLENGIARYLPLFTNPEKSNNAGFRGGSYGGVSYGGGGSITGLELTVGSCEETLSFSTDTSYEITTSDDMEVVSISSKTIYGVMYGMESLSQLIEHDTKNNQLLLTNVSPSLKISDQPNYNHRGLMLDTGRRFIPMSSLKSQIDAMAMNKLNVLHFHFADYCRFAINLPKYPELTNGLDDEQAGVYQVQDIRELIFYANERGVRVVPEVDMPGHSNWGVNLGLVTGGLKYCTDVFPTSLYDDPDGITVNTLKGILTEVVELFGGEELFHVGADETSSSDGEGCTIENIAGLENKIFQHLVSLGKTPVGWEEVFFVSNGADGFQGGKSIINDWSKYHPPETIDAGFDAIESYSAKFYLNNFPKVSDLWYDISTGLEIDKTKPTVNLKGGEISMWTDNYCDVAQCGAFNTTSKPVGSELYPPETNTAFTQSLAGMIWPLSSVGSAAFWNYDKTLTSEELQQKLDGVSRRFLERGVDACPSGCICDEVSRCGVKYLDM